MNNRISGSPVTLRIVVCIAVSLSGTACDGPPASDVVPAATVRNQHWQLAQPPRYSLSVVSGSRDIVFDQVVPRGILFDDSTAVVASGTAGELVWISAEGRIGRVAGGLGAGPAEFRALRSLAHVGDTLLAWDSELRRVSLFDRTGAYLHQIQVESPGEALTFVGGLPGASVVTARFERVESTQRLYYVWSSSGRIQQLRGPVDHPHPSLPARIAANQQIGAFYVGGHCLPTLLEDVRGSSIYIGDTGRGVLSRLDLDGTLTEIYRDDSKPLVTQGMYRTIEQIIVDAAALENARERIGGVGGSLRSAWSDLIAGGTGELWLRRAGCFDIEQVQTWDRITADGTRIGSVTLPYDVSVIAVRGDLVLVVRRDTMDVEHVELYALQQTAG